MTIIEKNKYFLFLSYFLLTLVLFYTTRHAGFVTDYTGFQERLENDDSIYAALDSFGFPAIQPLLNLIALGLYKLFGVGSIGYYIFYSLLHAINAYLAFSLFKKILHFIKIEQGIQIALFSSFLFLIQPYCVEPIVWKVCTGALVSTIFILLGLNAFVDYLLVPTKRIFAIIIGLTIMSLLTFEYAVIQFLLCFILYSALKKYIAISKVKVYSLIGALICCSIGYFILVKLFIGDWSGHSGSSIHFNFDCRLITSNYFRFFLKYVFFIRYFSYDVKYFLCESIANKTIIQLLVAALGLGIFLRFITMRYRLKNKDQDIIHFSFLMFCTGLIPVITMYHMYMFLSENDRHGYLASIFFSLFVVCLLFYICTSMRKRKMIIFLLVGLYLFLQQKTIQQWVESNEVYYSLLRDFRWYDTDEVYIMSVPDHFNGSYLFRTYKADGSGLYDGLKYTLGKVPKGQLIEVSQFNINDKSEGFKASRSAPDEVSAEFLQWGNWWHHLGLGGVAYETNKVKVRFEGQVAKVKLLSPAKDHVIIYMNNGKWYEIP